MPVGSTPVASTPVGPGRLAHGLGGVSGPGVPQGPLQVIERWPVEHAAAAVVAPDTVLAATGDPRRRYGFASLTKLVTALATHAVVESGACTLDDPAGPPGSTLRHLLAHASGLAPDEAKPLAPPGTRRIYSNAGYELLADHVAAASGSGFADVVEHTVLAPAGMASASLEGSPAAGLAGSLDDLVALARQFLAPSLVAPGTMAAMVAVAFPDLDGVLPGFGRQRPCAWGLGPEVRGSKRPHWTGAANSPSTYGHFGRSGTFLWVDPQRALACAVLTDRDFGDWAVRAWPALSDAVLAWAGAVR